MTEAQLNESGACCACLAGPVETHPHSPAPCLRTAEVLEGGGKAYCWLCHNANLPEARPKRRRKGPHGASSYPRQRASQRP